MVRTGAIHEHLGVTVGDQHTEEDTLEEMKNLTGQWTNTQSVMETSTWVKVRKTVETFETGKRLKRLKRLSVFLCFCEAQRCERDIYC